MISATDCLVAQQPAIADRVLRSEHGSDAESSAMDSLFAYASKCAGPKRPEALSRSFLRAFVADSMYHYTKWSAQRESASKDLGARCRSEESRGEKEGVSTSRYRGSTMLLKQKTHKQT